MSPDAEVPHPRRKGKNKPQARTEETLARILDAAQTVFAEQGFEKTQLEQVAARAGYSRGAIYAHYSSKEDVFLALMEQRVHAKISTISQVIEDEPDIKKRRGLFKNWVTLQACDPSWSSLNLEFKLYSMRQAQGREKLQNLYDLLFKSTSKYFVELLFGKGLDTATRASAERRLAIMGAVLSAVALESHLRPELLPNHQVQIIVGELYDALIHA